MKPEMFYILISDVLIALILLALILAFAYLVHIGEEWATDLPPPLNIRICKRTLYLYGRRGKDHRSDFKE